MIYTIKYCSCEEYPKLVDFIKKYWKADHIFVKSKVLFDFQHYNSIENRYEFLIGVNNETGEIDGVCGMIPLSHYDAELSKYNEIWGGIWKVRDDVKNDEISLLGLMLFERCWEYYSHASIGMSEIAYKFHKLKKYTMCYLNQYYILNNECDDFRIAVVPRICKTINTQEISAYSLKYINNIENVDLSNVDNNYRPRKSKVYLINRFAKHPIYKYMFWGIYNDDKIVDILVIRKIQINGNSVLRIVDIYGNFDNIPSLYNQFQILLKEEKCEYIDLMNYGISEDVFEAMGFTKLDVHGDIIIPNYFEPFKQANMLLNAAFHSPEPYRIYKADADQDRPNII